MKKQQQYSIPDLLQKKANDEKWTKEEIMFLVKSITDGSLTDGQLGALLMAIKIKNLERDELAHLTYAMIDSGRVIKWEEDWDVVDKHCTGGVGEKVSMPLVPALVVCGLKVPMISARGLGHTGGTIDKLESIAGYRAELSEEEMQSALREVGCFIACQTESVAPADRRMYATRDITGTVASLPLIVSSIISKKASASPKALVFDVKYGSGAFLQRYSDAKELAKHLVETAQELGITTTAYLTSNDTPIGQTVGNALEIEETIACLRGNGPDDLMELVTTLGAELLVVMKKVKSMEEGISSIRKALSDGSALNKFGEILRNQGVESAVVEALCSDPPDFSQLPHAKQQTKRFSPKTGTVTKIDALTIAKVCGGLGAGRSGPYNGEINYAVGVKLLKTVGCQIKEGEAWLELHHDQEIPLSILDLADSAIEVHTDNNIDVSLKRVTERIS